MFHIVLEEYKETRIYFQLFDVILKNIEITKESFLLEHKIIPSSYRLARKVEQNVGKSIILKLANLYNLKILSDTELVEIEEKLNKIYFEMYYKNYDDYENYLEYIDEMINKNLIIYPILKLFKLFLICHSNKSPKSVYNENYELYNEIINFKGFYNKDILEIFNIIKLFFDDSFIEKENYQEYKNPMAYQILASKCYIKEKYIESIYYATKAKDILLEEMNFKRYITVAKTLMACQLCIGDYKQCNSTSINFLNSVKALNLAKTEIATAEDYYYASLLGLKQFNLIYNKLKNKDIFNMNKYTCFLISMYKIDKNLFSNYIQENIDFNELDNEDCEYIKSLSLFLKNSDKKQIDKLKNHSIMTGIIKILKNY